MRPILICAQPCIPYYAWQIEVMLTNFRNLKIHEHFDIHCIFSYVQSEAIYEQHEIQMDKVCSKFLGEADFYYYSDNRQTRNYISSIRPNILKQHFLANPELSNRVVIYHDCDIVFTKFPDFITRLCNTNVSKMPWYVSDTKSYISSEYIKSKGDDIFQAMCSIVGIHPMLVCQKDKQAGGAQYIMHGIDYKFWDKVEADCEMLFTEITMMNKAKKAHNPDYHEVQIWCADMWAVLWNGWMRGYQTEIIPEMDFTWSPDPAEKWDVSYIFHNAGVTDADKERFFYKGEFHHKLPYGIDGSTYDKTKAGYKYFELIQQTAQNTCLSEQ